jgi:hypothetical protein
MKYNTLSTLQKKFLAEYRMKDQIIFGNYQGYCFYLQLDDKNFSHTLIINAKSEDNPGVEAVLKQLMVEYVNIDTFKYEKGHVSIHFLPFVEESKTIDSIYQVFDRLTQYLKENNYTNCCDLTNIVTDVELYETPKKEKLFVSATYANEWNQKEEDKYKEEEKKPFNLPLSLLISFLCMLPGSAIWILMFKDMRTISNINGLIGGALIMLGGFIGYTLISKKLDKKALGNVTILSAIMIVITQFFAFNTGAYFLLEGNQYFPHKHYFDVFQYYSIILTVNDYAKALIFSFCESIIAATIVLTFYARAVYVRRVNAYGVSKVVTDVIYAEDEDENEVKDEEVTKSKKKEKPYDEE